LQRCDGFNVKITLMKLLALDASTEFLSLALMVDENISSYYEHAGQTASQLILPQIQILLETAKIKLTDLDGIAFGAGPGAFTGVRIACGVAQGLGFGATLPVEAVSTLKALAQTSGASKAIVCTDARMGEVYHAAFERQDNAWIEVVPAGVYKPEAVPEIEGSAWIGVGSGWKAYDEVLSHRYQENIVEKMPNLTPMAEAILQLTRSIFESGVAKKASEARPIYIRNRVALTASEREQGQRL
jgi:tRNA threonylcarbamoyladenosine biosynthesis protein TsaB